jgi:site-specific DNA-methyltransferase (adenine-specific)
MTDIKLFNQSCYELNGLENESIDALITDPPYGLEFQNNDWDKPQQDTDYILRIPKKRIWEDVMKVLKPGGYGLVFSYPRLMHRVMIDLEDSGFLIKDVLMWAYLNGMPKTRNIGLDIDKFQNIESEVIGVYNYVQGYVKDGARTYKTIEQKLKKKPASEKGKIYDGAGINLKPAYEPIILIQKPFQKGLSVVENIDKYGTGALNLEATRIPYGKDDVKVGHNPHELGRLAANIVRSEPLEDNYDKYFLVQNWEDNYEKFYQEAKVRQNKEIFNKHPTLKPLPLMKHLVKLLTFDNQVVLDPFMGSGSTGLACLELNRAFVGYELNEEYFKIAQTRFDIAKQSLFKNKD